MRPALAALAVLTAALTGASAAALGASGEHVAGALAYVATAAFAAFFPAMIALQVTGGLLLAAGIALAPDAPSLLTLLPLVAGTVATAELLGVAARLDAPVARVPADDLRHAAIALILATAAYAAVSLVAALPGPSGLLAIAAASAACLAVALLLRGDADDAGDANAQVPPPAATARRLAGNRRG